MAVRTPCGLTEWFKVLVDLHHGLILSSLLFITVVAVICREIRGGSLWELLYADDLVLMAEDKGKGKSQFIWRL